MRILRYTSLVALIAGVACAQESDEELYTVTDSAGIRVVSNVGTAGVASGWRLADEPLFRTGWADGDPTFQFINTGVFRDDGSVAIADANGSTIYVLEPDGRVRHQLGGPGEGPGEFGMLNGIVAGAGDTLIGQDFSGGLSVFAGPELVSDRRVPWGWRVGMSVMEVADRVDGGALLLAPGMYSPRPGDFEWSQAPVLRLSPDLQSVDTLFLVDHYQRRPREDRNPIRAHGSVAVGGQWIIHGRSDRAEISWYDLAGQRVQIARWDYGFPEVTDADWETFEEAFLSRGSPEMPPERMNQLLAEQEAAFGGVLPPYRILLADAEGNVWLGDYTFAGDPATHYSLIAASGEWLGGIELPVGTRPLAIGSDLLLGVELNEWDVPAIVVYQIHKSD